MKTTFKNSSVNWQIEEAKNEDNFAGSFDEDGNYIFSDESEAIQYVSIDGVFTPKDYRRQGQAKACLALAIEEIKASYPGMEIKLAADPTDGISQDDLVAFYAGMGFVADDEQGGESVFMTYRA